MDKPIIVLIWSNEYKMWWRPDGLGYTRDRDEAGRYWLDDAKKRVKGCGPEKQLMFEIAALGSTRVNVDYEP
jgi:hypothetical protein